MCSRYTRLSVVLAALLPQLAGGQEEWRPIAPELRVEASDAGVRLVTRGLPAVSADGREVAFVVSRADYDDSSKDELRVAALSGGERRFPLTRAASNSAGKWVSTSQAELTAHVETASAALKAGRFVALRPAVAPGEASVNVSSLDGGALDVGPWRTTWVAATRTLVIARAATPTVRLTSKVVGLPWPSFWCGGDGAGPGCAVGFSWMQLWSDERVLFVTGGNNTGPDGSEVDELYLAIWPERKKWKVVDNRTP